MKQNTVLILGGYGNAGLVIARLLASQNRCQILLAGRNGGVRNCRQESSGGSLDNS